MTATSSPLLSPFHGFKKIHVRPSFMLGALIGIAVIFFEIFNYSTTQYALRDLLGDLKFAGLYWSTTLAIAFCAIDFAGIARLFTPQDNTDEPKETWFLFGAWLLAASMNAGLTWWGVAMAIHSHAMQSTTILEASTIQTIIPIFVAIMVWLIRILIIGTISAAGSRFFGINPTKTAVRRIPANADSPNPIPLRQRPVSQPVSAPAFIGTARSPMQDSPALEPTYHSLSMSAQPNRQ